MHRDCGTRLFNSITVLLTMILLNSHLAQCVAGTYSSAVLADGPVAYYRLGETSGSVAANSSANGSALDGAYTNFGASQTLPSTPSSMNQFGPRPGDSSGSNTILGFESDNIGIRSGANANAQVEIPDNNLLDITGTAPVPPGYTPGLTLEAWVYRNDLPQANSTNTEGIVGKFVGSPAGNNNRSYVLYYNPRGTPNIGFIVNTSTPAGTAGAAANSVDHSTGVTLPAGSTNGWTYLAAVFEPGVRMSVYLNGVSIGEKTTGVPNVPLFGGTGPLWIGRQFSLAAGTSFEGLIDEVAIYDKALTPAQILSHYQAATPEPCGVVLAVVGMAWISFWRLRRTAS